MKKKFGKKAGKIFNKNKKMLIKLKRIVNKYNKT